MQAKYSVNKNRSTYVIVSSSVVVDTGVPPELVDSPSAYMDIKLIIILNMDGTEGEVKLNSLLFQKNYCYCWCNDLQIRT